MKIIYSLFALSACFVVSNSQRRPCNTICPALYSPVCGEDRNGNQRTFSNRCELSSARCRTGVAYTELYEGECRRDNNNECGNQCNFILPPTPVCARSSDGTTRTFPSACDVGLYNRCRRTDFRVIYEGNCRREPPQPSCGACTFEYEPICGRDSRGQSKTFPNSCALRVENCEKNTDYRLISRGECRTPQTQCGICTLEYRPVCGRSSDGRTQTFGNPCELRATNCQTGSDFRQISQGECPRTPQCPANCPRNYQPVCGVSRRGNYRTFSNECERRRHNCENRRDYEKAYDGVCNS